MKLPVWWLLFVAAVIALIITAVSVAKAQRSADDWFALLAGIERDVAQADTEHRKIPGLNRDDRAFIRKMANELSVSAEAKPTPAQGQWLISIRAWVDAANK
jgi:hypothetical protein